MSPPSSCQPFAHGSAPGPTPTATEVPALTSAAAPTPTMSTAPSDLSVPNGAEPEAKLGAESRTNGLNHRESSPGRIVSDITDARPPTTTVSGLAHEKSSSPSINGLSMRTLNSNINGSTLRTPYSPDLHSPVAAIPPPSPPKHGITTDRWTDRHPHTQPYTQPRSPVTGPASSSTPVKVPIIDAAPGIGTPCPAPAPSSGFPSPGKENMSQNSKFKDDRTRITYSIRQALPDAARRSVRDNWEKCLLGSDFHQAFILNASIHHATPAAIQRGIRDFGMAMVGAAKNEIIDHLSTTDLDELSDRILAKASDRLLDKALERRLKTIEAKRLINALARAERLGYEPGDVDDNADLAPPQQPQQQQQQYQQSTSGHAYAQIPQQQNVTPTTASIPTTTLPLHCDLCFRRFTAQSAHDYHMKGKVCTRSPSSPSGFKYNCQHCGQGFTTVMGLQYHNANKVCGDFGETPGIKPTTGMPPLPTPTAQRVTTQPLPSTPLASSPAVKKSSYSPAPPPGIAYGTPGLTQPDGSIADPYAHLSPEQLAAMQEELREAEIKFSERMRQANLILNELEKKTRLDGLANSFGTKQSMIRKKYGVRLRMRRTRAEIQAERDRMQYKTAAELQADLGVVHNGPGRPVANKYRPSPGAGSRPGSRSGSIAGASGRGGWAAVNQPVSALTTLASSLSVPHPKIENSGEVSMHGGKRRLDGAEDGLPQNKRIAYSDMSGLGGAVSVDAEMTDPTKGSEVTSNKNSMESKGVGPSTEPVSLDDSASESGEDSSDEDIPNHLPASVRQSLQRSSSAAAPGISRPGSSST